MQRDGYQLVNGSLRKFLERHHPGTCAIFAQGVNTLHQWVKSVYFIVPVSADEENARNTSGGHHGLKQFERGRIYPLQVVKENNQRSIFRGNRFHELQEHVVETILRFRATQLWNRGLRSDDQLQIGNDIRQYSADASDGLLDVLFPSFQLRLASHQNIAYKLRKSLYPGKVGHILLQLVELALDYISLFLYSRLM